MVPLVYLALKESVATQESLDRKVKRVIHASTVSAVEVQSLDL